jgi:hypothetical protein
MRVIVLVYIVHLSFNEKYFGVKLAYPWKVPQHTHEAFIAFFLQPFLFIFYFYFWHFRLFFALDPSTRKWSANCEFLQILPILHIETVHINNASLLVFFFVYCTMIRRKPLLSIHIYYFKLAISRKTHHYKQK